MKFYNKGSSYKEAMLKMTQNTPVVADHISGDFTMPQDKKQKLAFIAGGIGVTPFRSMIKYLADKNEGRDVVMLYSARTKDDFSYAGVFEQARQERGVKTIYVVTGKDHELPNRYSRRGRIGVEMIRNEISDYMERTFYLSGTQSMVDAMKDTLKTLGVPKSHIKVDYFSGYN